MKFCPYPNEMDALSLAFWIFDDFLTKDTTIWSSTLTDTGTANCTDAAGGVIALIPSDGTVADNDEAYIHVANETFKFADDKPLVAECRIQFTEANVDDANVMFGLLDAPGANSIQDNGAGPPASYSGVNFHKVDGGTTWIVENSIAGTQKTTTLDATGSLTKAAITAGGAASQVLRIEVRPITSTLMDIIFSVDGVVVAKHKDQPMASATEMKLFVGVKNGGANNETVNVDYIWASQKR